jgi:hypothetical protein
MSKRTPAERPYPGRLSTGLGPLATAVGHDDPLITGWVRDNGLPRLNEKQLAERWGVSVRTLQAARVKGDGVPFVRIGRAVRYRLEDVLAYEQARLRTNTSETP